MKTYKVKVKFEKTFEVRARSRNDAIRQVTEKCAEHKVFKHWYERDGHLGVDCSEWRYANQDYLKRVELVLDK